MDKDIIILFGGDSNERLVSVASAQFMAQALPKAKLWFWHKNGPIFAVESTDLLAHDKPFTDEFIPKSSQIYCDIKNAINSNETINYIFILALHGGFSENGGIQLLFEEAGRYFTGSKSGPSKIAFDKVLAKKALEIHKIPLIEHIELNANNENIFDDIKNFVLKYEKAVLKPKCGGSSLGCLFIKNVSDIEMARKEIIKNPTEDYLLEKLVIGKEITVGIIERNNELLALPCTEVIIDNDRNFDYEGKYLAKGSKEITPANISENLAQECQRIAKSAHLALSLNGYSRTDIMVGEEGPVFIEVNTLPGLSKMSFIPQQLASNNISMREFLEWQIENCQK